MLRQMEGLKSYSIVATDGKFGKAADLLFDDAEWTVRHVVVDTGGWLTGRSVLIPPHTVESIDDSAREIRVSLTKSQVEHSPSIDTDLPVSRQWEDDYYAYYGVPNYWTGPYLWGPWIYPREDEHPDLAGIEAEERAQARSRFNPNLRSFNKVNGYRVEATDGGMGDIEDMIMDVDSWSVRYLVVDTSKLLPSRNVLLPPEDVDRVSWEDSTVYLEITKQQLKDLPTFKSIEDAEPQKPRIVTVDRK
jgi:hypothetical protein